MESNDPNQKVDPDFSTPRNAEVLTKSRWEISIPWFTTVASVIMLAILGFFLVLNIEWFKNMVFDSRVPYSNEPEYRFYAYHMHLSMIKRSVGLFSGFAIMFLGMSVVFYTLKEKITGDFKSAGVSASIATASPGIIAILVGGYLIIASIESKDEFPKYRRIESQWESEPSDLPKPPGK